MTGGRQKQPNLNDNRTTVLGGMQNDYWSGQGGPLSANRGWSYSNNPTAVPTGNGDAKLFDDYRFDVLMYKRVSNPGDHRFLVLGGFLGSLVGHVSILESLVISSLFLLKGCSNHFLCTSKQRWVQGSHYVLPLFTYRLPVRSLN